MNRRKFLGMLGVAPLVGALLGVAPAKPRLFWAGTTIPRNEPLPPELYEHVAKNAWPSTGIVPVEVVTWDKTPLPEAVVPEMKVIAHGWINRAETIEKNIPICPDYVVRISDLLWDSMTDEARKGFLLQFHAV